ncbi:efflux RND transporter periplasmic adaptor subunit [Ruegeria arenilitoris]|uniref:efflux RND transporter periplasmic adaptor subunit n=1 Tax=Ruegeria arenilitoris TaxID=1173585 RepID=UPI00147C5765|nr:efflux RND transporter periplasmic adaptor subunit [Ruegeria arenilitoris]
MKNVVAFAMAVLLGSAASADVLEFEGKVLPSERGIITSQIDGIVEVVFHGNGTHVTEGEPIIQLDETDARLVLDMANARLQQAQATLAAATARANRQRELLSRGISAEAAANPAITAQKVAEANLALAHTEVTAAEIALNRTVIRAPIAGVVSKASTAKGMFVEAEANQELGEIIVIDPVLIAYEVDYDTRLDTMTKAGVSSLEALFDRLSVSISLASGAVIHDGLSPERASLELNDAGHLTVWLRVPNSDQLLRPGLSVRVTSTLLHSGVQN